MFYSATANIYKSSISEPTFKETYQRNANTVAVARSFNGLDWTKLDDNSPIFSSGIADAGLVDRQDTALQKISDDEYVMYFMEGNSQLSTGGTSKPPSNRL